MAVDRGGRESISRSSVLRAPWNHALGARGAIPAAFMHLPDIAPGKRFTLPRPTGSADALLLARFAERAARARQASTAIVTAEPGRRAAPRPTSCRSSRPTLRVAVFPDWETLPYDTFSPHQDLISERLATLWRIRQGEVDVVLMPATTALVAPGAAELPGRLHLPLQAEGRSSTRRR